MYVISQTKLLPEDEHLIIAKQNIASFPPGYLVFLQKFGAGNYRGWINVYSPDTEVLKPFADYDFWEHDENSPITQQQISQCIAIGTTIDGDFLAVHPQTDQLLWLPRHADQIEAISLQAPAQEDERTYAIMLDEIYRQVYRCEQDEAVYYEPCSNTQSHLFLRLPPNQGLPDLPELAAWCRAAFPPDLTVENEYTCRLFYQRLGGYIRFNYAYKQEVAIMYEQAAQQEFADIKKWLLSQGCEYWST
ncbi:hypothetical protein [Paenibacillus sp. GXUN7292]|uniref:hypothetical protein n=1 Tax=Paenibacillus sp. GXUN7292 TaxID=3422499 RepID=UPI003D7DC74F